MKSILMERPGHLELRLDDPAAGKPGAGEALVRVHRAAICGTDIHAFFGRHPAFTYPRIPGHELGVEVVEVGENVTHVRPGDRCSVEPYLTTPGDLAHRRGRTNCSASLQCLGVHCDGGMREELVLPARYLHASASLSFEQLALVETMAIGRHAVERASLLDDERVAVIGLGPIGLSVIQFLLLRGLDVTAVDTNPARVESCRKLYPAARVWLNGPARDLRADLAQALGGEPPETVFDATGNAKSMEAAIDLPAHGGKVVFVGLVQGRLGFDDASLHRRELSLFASRNAIAADFQAIIRQMEAGLIDVRPWFTHRATAEEFPQAFSVWLQPDSGLLKGVVVF